MFINMGSIMAKVRAWEKSEEGQKRINAVMEQYRKEGRTATAAGSRIVTEKEMRQAANKLAELVKETARRGDWRDDYDISEHVLEDIDSLQPSAVIRDAGDGRRVIFLTFRNDLSRESLRKKGGERTGKGVDNIIALFNNGYEAGDSPYGWWDGHAPYTKKNIHYGNHDDAWVQSTADRPALRFLQQAVSEFNSKYGAGYGVKAELSGEYTKG